MMSEPRRGGGTQRGAPPRFLAMVSTAGTMAEGASHASAPHLPTDLSMVRLQMTAKGGTSCDGPASLIDSGLNLRKQMQCAASAACSVQAPKGGLTPVSQGLSLPRWIHAVFEACPEACPELIARLRGCFGPSGYLYGQNRPRPGYFDTPN